MLKKSLLALLVLGLMGGIGLYGAKIFLVIKANERADSFLAGAPNDSATDVANYAARRIYQSFKKDGHTYTKPYLFARSKLPSGVFELNAMEGWCDDAARACVHAQPERH